MLHATRTLSAIAASDVTLGPGARYVQDVDDTTAGFKLGSDEELWIYRTADHEISDTVDWAEGASPATMSYRRMPDVFGPYATGAQTRGTANQP